MSKREKITVQALVAAIFFFAGCSQPDQQPNATSFDRESALIDQLRDVAILGDTYTLGIGSTDQSGGYVQPACTALRWRCITSAKYGSGYINPGSSGSTFIKRLDSLVATDPTLVVVQGGTFDTDSPPAEVTTAAKTLYRAINMLLPRATIVAVGPVTAPGVRIRRLVGTRDAIRIAATSTGTAFIDPIDGQWVAEKDDYLPSDGLSLSNQGYRDFSLSWIKAFEGLK